MSENERGEGGESSGGSSGRRLPSTWWAALLKAAGRHLGFDDISLSQSEHVNVLSACTGCSAESWVLKALGIKFSVVSASDTDADYRAFVMENFPNEIQHMFCSIEDQISVAAERPSKCPCLACLGNTEEAVYGATDETVDLMVCGSPCDPYSVQRHKRHCNGNVESHSLFNTTMRDMVRMFELYSPVVAITEQVPGFLLPFHKATTETPYDRLLLHMKKGNMKFGGYFLVKFEMDSALWMQMSRPRCYIIFFRKDKFEKAHVKRFKTLVEDILDWLAANHSPRSMTSLMLEECSPLFAEEWQQTYKQRRGAQAASLQAPQQWQVQSSKIRQELGVGQSTQLWTSHPDLKLAGVPENARVKEVLDLAVYGYLGSDLACQLLAGRQAADAEALKSMCSELFTDISQNPYRKTFTRKNGHAPCMTTATSFYCHSRDRMVLPVEMLYFQGHDLRMKIPSQMPRSSLQSLAGQGICLPVLATLVFCLQNTDSLPV
ncbi:unnamed protein product [Symbiodinium sp. CCMP2592]|nr:unnamed protein product [Symbiodinium sp. CCMP2592]